MARNGAQLFSYTLSAAIIRIDFSDDDPVNNNEVDITCAIDEKCTGLGMKFDGLFRHGTKLIHEHKRNVGIL